MKNFIKKDIILHLSLENVVELEILAPNEKLKRNLKKSNSRKHFFKYKLTALFNNVVHEILRLQAICKSTISFPPVFFYYYFAILCTSFKIVV